MGYVYWGVFLFWNLMFLMIVFFVSEVVDIFSCGGLLVSFESVIKVIDFVRFVMEVFGIVWEN